MQGEAIPLHNKFLIQKLFRFGESLLLLLEILKDLHDFVIAQFRIRFCVCNDVISKSDCILPILLRILSLRDSECKLLCKCCKSRICLNLLALLSVKVRRSPLNSVKSCKLYFLA